MLNVCVSPHLCCLLFSLGLFHEALQDQVGRKTFCFFGCNSRATQRALLLWAQRLCDARAAEGVSARENHRTVEEAQTERAIQIFRVWRRCHDCSLLLFYHSQFSGKATPMLTIVQPGGVPAFYGLHPKTNHKCIQTTFYV